MKKNIVLFSIFFMFFSSCEWEPAGVYELDVNQNTTPPNIEIVEFTLDLNQDTVDLFDNERIYFNFQSSDQRIKWISIFIDGYYKGSIETNKGYFTLQPAALSQGYHSLRIELFTGSGTGSIADGYGFEGYLFTTREWVINVQLDRVIAEVANGFLKFKWYKDDERSITILRDERMLCVSDSDEYIDSTYVGEGATYTFIKDNLNGVSGLYKRILLPKEIPVIKYIYDENNHPTLYWEKPKYYSAVDSIFLFYKPYNYNIYEPLEKFESTAEPNYIMTNALFGNVFDFKLLIRPKKNNPSYDYSSNINLNFQSTVTKCKIGTESPLISSFLNLNINEFIYIYSTKDTLYRYSSLENRVIQKFKNPFNNPINSTYLKSISNSPSGNYFLAYIGQTKKVFLSSSYDFTNYKIVDLSEFLIYSSYPPIAISNSGIGLIKTESKIYLFDFENDMLLWQKNITASINNYGISSDGSFFYIRDYSTIWFYKYTNNTISLIRTITSNSSLYYDEIYFDPNDPEKFVGWNKVLRVINKLSISYFSVISSIPYPDEFLKKIDFYNNQILSYDYVNFKFIVRSLIDGSIITEIPTPFHFDVDRCNLSGNSLYTNTGFRYYIH